jgi:hypothetical protein
MADLSKPTIRGTTSQRITENRDRLIQTSRTERESIRVLADQRDAATGDARADDIRRSLGMLTQTVNQVGGQLIEEQDKKNTAQGATDGLTGALDPQKAKNRAYSNAYFTANAVSTQTVWQTSQGEELEKLVNNPDMSPEEIEQAFTTATAARIKQVSEAYSDSPEAQSAAIKSLQQWTAQVQPKLHAAIKDRTDTQLLTDTQTNIATKLKAGQAVDWYGDAKSLIAGGVDADKVREAQTQALIVAMTDGKDPHPELAINATNAKTPARDGHPEAAYFTAEQMTRLRNAAIQAENQKEHNTQEAQKLSMVNFQDEIIKGNDRNYIPKLVKLRDTGAITVDQFNDVAGTLQRYFGAKEEGWLNQEAYLNLKKLTIQPNPNWSSVLAAARKADLGSGFAAERARLEIMGDASQGIRSDQARAEARANVNGGAPRMNFSQQNGYGAAQNYFQTFGPSKDQMDRDKDGKVRLNYFNAYRDFANDIEANPNQDPFSVANKYIERYGLKKGGGQTTTQAGAKQPLVYDQKSGTLK